jgi:hypothetical protein
MMRRTLFTAIPALLVFLPFMSHLAASESAWIMSIPHALSAQHVYKVKILAVDGEAQSEVFQYPVSPGKHRIKLELMLDVEWEPDLVESERPPPQKVYELDAEEGKSYQLAARVNIDAPAEAQLDQSYWEVFIYRVD